MRALRLPLLPKRCSVNAPSLLRMWSALRALTPPRKEKEYMAVSSKPRDSTSALTTRNMAYRDGRFACKARPPVQHGASASLDLDLPFSARVGRKSTNMGLAQFMPTNSAL